LVKQAQGIHKSAKESIKLITLNKKGLEYVAKPVVIAKGAANRVKLNYLDASQIPKVPMVNEFLMSFSRNCQSCHLTMTLSL
jgi:hypothetical protein